jgi:hypothetical protein
VKHLRSEKPGLAFRGFDLLSMTIGATILSMFAATTFGPARAELTGKERLGAKWKDEQRVDNCKVPPEKRGVKPRPNSCAHVRHE